MEAELGVIPNGPSEPDILGYEVKRTAVPSSERLESSIKLENATTQKSRPKKPS